MRFLGIGEYCSLGDMYYRLGHAGHEVKVYIADPEAQDIFGGMVQLTPHWSDELEWITAAGKDGIILFESAVNGWLQDQLRSNGYQVIGGSAFGDRLESERDFGQAVLRELGLQTARSHRYTDFSAAMEFIRATPARYVFKINGADSMRARNYVGQMDDGSDMLALLELQQAQWREAGNPDFVLMEFIEGIEVGVGAYFNGESFLQPACLDWEHKKLFPGDLGELTDEMGTVVTYRGAERIFDLTLARMREQLRASGYCGYINLNLIANEQGIWPLEFTSRFGYPGFAICETLHMESWDSIFRKMLERNTLELSTRSGFATGVVLTVPPYPYAHGYAELSKGTPIAFRGSLTAEEHRDLHFAEVAVQRSQLVTSGMTGYVGVATGAGDSVAAACDKAYALAHKVVVPNLRYRLDIGERVMRRGLSGLRALGYLD
ncbi:MAG TPA: phosphoribosylamine--glycine ligase [Gammaproteobacteria bacterium]